MLGQKTLFSPDKELPLRQRVDLMQISLVDARYMLKQFHYLHRTRVGRQINYAVVIDGVVDGVITYAYPMMSASILGVASDELLEFARLYLHQNIPHTATCAIGKSLKRVKADWMRMFPDAKEPRLIISWSDATRHKGTIYKAANFMWLHRTKQNKNGKSSYEKEDSERSWRKSRKESQLHSDYNNTKDCWIYWL